MPRLYIDSTMSADAAAGARMVGLELRLAIVRELDSQPGQTMTGLARRLKAGPTTVRAGLRVLVADGLVLPDQSDDERRRGRPVRYSLDVPRARTVLKALLEHVPESLTQGL